MLDAAFFTTETAFRTSPAPDRLGIMRAIVVEIREDPVGGTGCSLQDRRTFGRRTIPRLLEEFGALMEVRWQEPPRASVTLPTISIDGRPVHSGGYLSWETLRPIVAHAIAVQLGVDEFTEETARRLRARGWDCPDWQDGLLRWLQGRCETDGP